MTRNFTLSLIAVFILSGLIPNLLAQPSKRDIRKKESTAYDLLANERFSDALIQYNELESIKPDNEEYKFYTGIAYLGVAEYNKAIGKFDEIINEYERNDEQGYFTQSAYFYKGKAYHRNYQFDKAKDSYNELAKFNPDEDDQKVLNAAIEEANVAQDLFLNMSPVVVTRLAVLNSDSDEHTAIPADEGNVLIFTGKWENGLSGDKLSDEGKYYEDIWIWNKNNGITSTPYNPGKPLNTVLHEATCGLSLDGTKLFVYKSDKKDAGDIYLAEATSDSTFSKPEKMTRKVNRRLSVERQASLSPSGDTLYYSTDRKWGNKGGRDLWFAVRNEKGEYVSPTLIEELSTEKDEEAPYMLEDGKTLYFSSKGYPGMGGYDVYKSVLQEDGSWSKPENLGFPINTVEDDIFYFPLADEKIAYYTRRKGGNSDIYKVMLYGAEDDVILVEGTVKDNYEYSGVYPIEKETGDSIYYNVDGSIVGFMKDDPIRANPDSVIVSKIDAGEVVDTTYFVPDEEKILVMDVDDGKYKDAYTTNSDEGDYQILILNNKTRKVVFTAPGHVFDTYNIPENTGSGNKNDVYDPILVKIETGKTEKNKLTPTKPASTDFPMITQRELEVMAEEMKKNPGLFVSFSTGDYLDKKDQDDPRSQELKKKAVEYLVDEGGIDPARVLTDLSPNKVPGDNIRYTIYDEETLEKAKKDKEDRTKENEITEPEEKLIVVVENVFFDFNKFKLRVKPNAGLDELAEYMKRNSEARIEIIGYTDGVGSDSYNLRLSKKRSATVLDYLKEKGVGEDQISYKGFGEDNPITKNKKAGAWFEESKQYNRRVELRILSQGQPKLIIKQFLKVPEEHKNPDYNPNYGH